MANFDRNKWYQIIRSGSTEQSMDGSYLYDKGAKGATFFKITDTNHPEQQWQFFPYNSTTYVLRTKASGPFGYMTAVASQTETTPGGTVIEMTNCSLADMSMFWQVSPWGDGSFFFTNAANGSAWHLFTKPNSLMAMSSNISKPQEGQRYSFNTLTAINDTRFSTLRTPFTTSSSTSLSIPTPTITSSLEAPAASVTPVTSVTTTPSGDSSGGLTAGASAAIGASIGGVALIILLIGAFIFFRRRRSARNQLPIEKENDSHANTNADYMNNTYEAKMKHLFTADPNSPPSAELPAEYPHAELPADRVLRELPADLYGVSPVARVEG